TNGTVGGPGTLAITGGTFTYSGGTMNGAGVTSVAPGATLAVTGPISIGDTRELDVGGLRTITGDTFVGFSNTALIHLLAPGILHWSGGDQSGPGTTTVAPGGQVLIDNSCSDATLRDGRQLVNQGTMQLTRHSIVAMFGSTDPAIDNSGTIDIDDSVAGDCTD